MIEQRIRVMLNGSLRVGEDKPLVARLAKDYENTLKACGPKEAERSLLSSIEWHRECRKVIGIKRHSFIFDTVSPVDLECLGDD